MQHGSKKASQLQLKTKKNSQYLPLIIFLCRIVSCLISCNAVITKRKWAFHRPFLHFFLFLNQLSHFLFDLFFRRFCILRLGTNTSILSLVTVIKRNWSPFRVKLVKQIFNLHRNIMHLSFLNFVSIIPQNFSGHKISLLFNSSNRNRAISRKCTKKVDLLFHNLTSAILELNQKMSELLLFNKDHSPIVLVLIILRQKKNRNLYNLVLKFKRSIQNFIHCNETAML